MGARAGAGADQDIDAEILERRVQNLFDVGHQSMDFVDEENLPRPHVGQHPGEVELLLQYGAGGLLIAHAQLGRDDVGQRGLAQAGRTVKQHVIHRFIALLGGFDGNRQVLFQASLAGEVGQPLRAQSDLELLFIVSSQGRNDSAIAHG